MEINIPTNFQLYCSDIKVKNNSWSERVSPMNVCFKHAVMEAIKGTKIESEFIESNYSNCYLCDNEKK